MCSSKLPLAQEKPPTVRDVSILVSLCLIHHVLGYMIVSLREVIDVCPGRQSRKTMRTFWLKATASKASKLSFTVHDAFSASQ